MSRTALAIALLAAVPGLMPAQSRSAGPAHIILIRHADKPADATNPHLSPAGTQRAQHLVTFITSDPAMTALGAPVAIYATRTTKDGDGVRTQETVAPLAQALKLTVLLPEVGKNYAAVAAQILANPAYAGKTILICWNHEEIPQLAAALGVKPRPAKWKGSIFDQVDVVSYHKGKAELAVLHYPGT